MLSSVVDPSDGHLTKWIVRKVCRAQEFPTSDVFARSNKDEHHASTFFTLYYCPDASGVDELMGRQM